jgi:glycosyltransferase involved in cell wall biosynthesis
VRPPAHGNDHTYRRPVQIAVVLEQCLGPVPGGTGRYAFEIAAALAERPEVQVSGWTAWHRDTSAARVPRVRGPHRLRLPRRPLVAAWERGLGPVPAGSADVVHAPTLLAPPRRRRPLVVTVHDAVPWTHPETLTPRGVRWHRLMAERIARSADAIVVPTRAVERELHRHLRMRRVVVVGEGARESLWAAPDPGADTHARLGVPTEGGYLLTVATLEPRKGLDVLVRALAGKAAPQLPLVVVGRTGWGGVDPLRLAADVGLPPERLRLLGNISDQDLAVVLRGATALVVPSRSEGFGLPALEGMAAGVPVVTSDDPALVEVGGGATVTAPVGDVAALADALAQVVSDAALRARMTAAGRTRAAEFGWDKAAAALIDLYSDLV